MGLGQSTRALLEEVDSQTEWGEAMFVLFVRCSLEFHHLTVCQESDAQGARVVAVDVLSDVDQSERASICSIKTASDDRYPQYNMILSLNTLLQGDDIVSVCSLKTCSDLFYPKYDPMVNAVPQGVHQNMREVYWVQFKAGGDSLNFQDMRRMAVDAEWTSTHLWTHMMSRLPTGYLMSYEGIHRQGIYGLFGCEMAGIPGPLDTTTPLALIGDGVTTFQFFDLTAARPDAPIHHMGRQSGFYNPPSGPQRSIFKPMREALRCEVEHRRIAMLIKMPDLGIEVADSIGTNSTLSKVWELCEQQFPAKVVSRLRLTTDARRVPLCCSGEAKLQLGFPVAHIDCSVSGLLGGGKRALPMSPLDAFVKVSSSRSSHDPPSLDFPSGSIESTADYWKRQAEANPTVQAIKKPSGLDDPEGDAWEEEGDAEEEDDATGGISMQAAINALPTFSQEADEVEMDAEED